MKLPRTKSTLLWRSALRDIAAVGRVLDPEEIVWLWQLADRITNPAGRRLPFTRAPILLPSHCPSAISHQPLALYPITLQATDWLLAVSAWWPGSDLIPAAFACAHSDGANHPIFHQPDRTAIQKAVSSLGALPCTPEDLRLAVQIQTNTPDAQIETDPARKPDPSVSDWGEILAILSGAYHIPPWELIARPYADISDLLDALPRVAALYKEVCQNRDSQQALREFQEAVVYLKRGGQA